MMSFRGNRLGEMALPVGSVWLMTDIAEAKGRQQLYGLRTGVSWCQPQHGPSRSAPASEERPCGLLGPRSIGPLAEKV